MEEIKKWFGLFGNKELAREGFYKADRRQRGEWLGKDINKYRKRRKQFEEANKEGQIKLFENNYF